ncbi:MAG: GNAT family N-acetyltransferase [bacterium]
MEEFEVVPAISLPPGHLKDFYYRTYADRADFLTRHWKWIYSGGTPKNSELWPIIAKTASGQLIGHASTIPATFCVGGEKVSGRWFVDFFVSPDSRGGGVGSVLIKKIMDSASIVIAIGASQQGARTFLKHGWAEHSDSTLFYLPINISRHPRFRSNILSKGLSLIDVVRRIFYNAKAGNRRGDYSLDRINHEIPTELHEQVPMDYRISQLHDPTFFEWRLVRSPMRDQIYLYRSHHSLALIRLIKGARFLRLNILKVKSNSPKDFCQDMLHIALQYRADEIAVVSSTNSQQRIFEQFFPIRKPLPFFLFSNPSLQISDLPITNSRWEFIDSDLDLAYSDH